MTDERMAAIQARLDARTPGEWQVNKDEYADDNLIWNMSGECDESKHGHHSYDGSSWISTACDDCMIIEPESGGSLKIKPADTNLIAHAPADIGYLLAKVERLEERLEVGKKSCSHCAVNVELGPHHNKMCPNYNSVWKGEAND